MTLPNADNDVEVRSEILRAYHRYVDAFNALDLDTAIGAVAFPCSDLRTVGGRPLHQIYADVSEMRSYFESVVQSLLASGWRGTSRILEVQIWALGSEMVTLMSDFERRTTTGERIGIYRVFYNLLRSEAEWKIVGFVTPDAGFPGIGGIPLDSDGGVPVSMA